MKAGAFIIACHARQLSALVAARKAFARGGGILGACKRLGISRRTLYRHAERWPAMGKIVARGTMTTEEASALGVKARLRA